MVIVQVIVWKVNGKKSKLKIKEKQGCSAQHKSLRYLYGVTIVIFALYNLSLVSCKKSKNETRKFKIKSDNAMANRQKKYRKKPQKIQKQF